MPVPLRSKESCVCHGGESEISLCSYHKQQRSQKVKSTRNNVESKHSITIKKSVSEADDQAWAEILQDLKSISKVISNTDNKNKQQCCQDNIGDLSNVKSITIKISRTGSKKPSTEKTNVCRPGKTKPCREAINEVRMDFVKRLKQAFEECNCTSCHCLGDMFEPRPTSEKECSRDNARHSESGPRSCQSVPTPKTTSKPAPHIPSKGNTGAKPEAEGVYEVMVCSCKPCDCEQCRHVALLKSAHAKGADCCCKTDKKALPTILDLYPSGVFTFPQYKKEYEPSIIVPPIEKSNFRPCDCKEKAQEQTVSQQVYDVHTTILDKNRFRSTNGLYYPNPQKSSYSLSSPYMYNESSTNADDDFEPKSIEDKSTLCQLLSLPHNEADVSVVVLLSTSSRNSKLNNKRMILNGHKYRNIANPSIGDNTVDILKKSILEPDLDMNLSEGTVTSKVYSDRYQKEYRDSERDSYYSCKTLVRQEESTNVSSNEKKTDLKMKRSRSIIAKSTQPDKDSKREKLLQCKSNLSEIITNIRAFSQQLMKTIDKFEKATKEVKKMAKVYERYEARTLYR